MLRLRSRFLDALSFDAPVVACDPDPIDDPVFGAMSRRDLADLPFARPAPRGAARDGVDAGEPPRQETHAIRSAA